MVALKRGLKGSGVELSSRRRRLRSIFIKRSLATRGHEIGPKQFGRDIMATYECSVCEMSVNATCGKCDAR